MHRRTALTDSGPVVALYVMPTTIYRTLGIDCWDRHRDARQYKGPGPIIAHPPCGHWGRYRHTCKQPGKDCGPIAMDQVRRFGGILEHPASSRLFTYCGTPRAPGQYDLHGGQIVLIPQSHYGHQAEKMTALYIVGIDGPPHLLPPTVPLTTRRLERLTEGRRTRTPLRFALLLLAIASQIRK